jgi:hypothetical protein
MSDRVLLEITGIGGLWLPDRTLVEGTPSEVRQSIASAQQLMNDRAVRMKELK